MAALLLAVLLSSSAVADPPPCADCHEVDLDRFTASVHGVLDCTDCHAGAGDEPHPPEVAEARCADCHPEAVEGLIAGVHSTMLGEGAPWVGGCLACHGEAHALAAAADAASPVSPPRLAATCGACHADPAMAQRFELRRARPVEAYLASVHARALAEGRAAADCASCHGSHAVFPASDPRSRVFHRRVPETCGDCHGVVAAVYATSIHGRAAAAGVREAPVCTNCHGEHRIASPEEVTSPVYASNVPRLTCGHCHGDLRLVEKFGLDPATVPAYEDSYHGLASRTGALTVAHCASCHGVHDILPSTDPRSHVHPANLAATCGRCHPGAGTVFAVGRVHVLPTEREHAAVYWVRRVYLWLISLTVGAMLLHNLLDLYRKARDPICRPPPGEVPVGPPRMGLGFRLTHGLLAASFVVLAYTGFALAFPEAWWARPLLAWESELGLRGWIHRAAAITMLGAALLHLVHLGVDRRARACIAAMRPRRADLTELFERLAYYLGLRRERPPAPWLGYTEKIEYWAVVWGTAVMAATGFVLWFETLALRWLPKWALDVATVIHLYEAVLACLAIFVWHFYAVIFDPVVYPMDGAWLSGRDAPGRVVERAPGSGEAPGSPAPAGDEPATAPAPRGSPALPPPPPAVSGS